MKRILLAGATLFALTAAQPTLAADAPVYKGPAPVAAALFNWSGFYVGVSGGYGWAQTNWINSIPPSGTFSGSGWVGGGTVGFNWQNGVWVFGIEADYSAANIDPSTTNGACGGGTACETKLDSLGTVRGRLGYTVTPTVLLYVTGGWAFSQITNTYGGVGEPVFFRNSANGWTVGGGIEAVLAGNWTGKIEYLHVDFGTNDVCGIIGCAPTGIQAPVRAEIVRVGLNFKFGG
jgi:outer membrane immunogenic protein